MHIVGKQVNSFVDYDGNISYVVFTAGCNMDCWYCHNRDILRSKDYLSQEEIIQDIKNRQGFIDAVVVTGGEPTLQKDLYEFVKIVKGIGLKVKLDTNGTNPEIVEKLIKDNLIDYVAMDIKTSLATYKTITRVEDNIDNIKKTISILLNSPIDYEFRTTMAPTVDRIDIVNIAKALVGAKLYVIQQFRHNEYTRGICDLSPYTAQELESFGKIASQYLKNVKIRA